MRKKKQCCPPADDIPVWFMTYSDVITLLMTFFILLLTFATNEPESFERMQTVMFGGGSATGVIGERIDSLDRDATMLRHRPRAARQVLRGSEMPPMYSDPAYESVAGGLEALEDAGDEDEFATYVVTASLPQLVDDEGVLSATGQRQFHALGRQLRTMPVGVRLEVANASRLEQAMALTQYLVTQQQVPAARISVGINTTGLPNAHSVRLTLDRLLREQTDGP